MKSCIACGKHISLADLFDMGVKYVFSTRVLFLWLKSAMHVREDWDFSYAYCVKIKDWHSSKLLRESFLSFWGTYTFAGIIMLNYMSSSTCVFMVSYLLMCFWLTSFLMFLQIEKLCCQALFTLFLSNNFWNCRGEP